MAIQIIGELTAKNSGTFALVDSNAIRGGLHVYNSLADLSSIPADKIKIGMFAVVLQPTETLYINKSTGWEEFKLTPDTPPVPIWDYLADNQTIEFNTDVTTYTKTIKAKNTIRTYSSYNAIPAPASANANEIVYCKDVYNNGLVTFDRGFYYFDATDNNWKPLIAIPTRLSEFINDPGFITADDVPSWAMQTDKPTYTADEVGAIPASKESEIINSISSIDNHSHNNATVIDKLSEDTDGNLLYDGKEIISGSQIELLPPASADNLGVIYQYIGQDTTELTNGFFYKCILRNNNYNWEAIAVQTNLDESGNPLVTRKELDNHVDNNILHTSASEKLYWNNKADGTFETTMIDPLKDKNKGKSNYIVDSSYLYKLLKNTDYATNTDLNTHINDADVHVTAGVNTIISNLSDDNGILKYNGSDITSEAVSTHTSDNDIHVTAADKVKWDTKSDYSPTNTSTLNKLGETADGRLSYNGQAVSNILQAQDNVFTVQDHTLKLNFSDLKDNQLKLNLDGLYVPDTAISNTAGNMIVKNSDGLYVAPGSINISSDAGNIIENRADGLFVPDDKEIAISSTPSNIIKKVNDGIVAEIKISSDSNNSLEQHSDGLYVPPSAASVSAESGNTLVTKPDGLFVPEVAISTDGGNLISKQNNGLYARTAISNETGNIIINKNDGIYAAADHTHTNQNVLDKLGTNTNGSLTYDGVLVAGSDIPISDDSNNIIKLGTDGLYASIDISAEADNTIVAKSDGLYSKVAISNESGNKIVKKQDGLYSTVAISAASDNTIVEKQDGLYVAPPAISNAPENIIKFDNGELYASVDVSKDADNSIVQKSDGLYVATPSNKSILDNINVNSNGALTYNGTMVAQASVDISSEADNRLLSKADGLYVGDPAISSDANNQLSMHQDGLYSALEDISASHNNIITRNADGLYASIPVSQDTDNILSLNNNGLYVPAVDNSALSHLLLQDIGNYTHEELEVMIEQHITNTTLHNSESVNTIAINGSAFNDGTLNSNIVINNELNLCLQQIANDPIEYTTQNAVFTSKVYDSGVENCVWVTADWSGQYSINHTNINIRYRLGSTPIYNVDTWSEWTTLGVDKRIHGIGRYIQIEFSFATDDKYRNVIIKNINLYFGVNIANEINDARFSADNTVHYESLKERLDYLETRYDITSNDIQNAITADAAELLGGGV